MCSYQSDSSWGELDQQKVCVSFIIFIIFIYFYTNYSEQRWELFNIISYYVLCVQFYMSNSFVSLLYFTYFTYILHSIYFLSIEKLENNIQMHSSFIEIIKFIYITQNFIKRDTPLMQIVWFLVRPYVVRSDPESRNVCVSVCVLSHFTDEDFNCLYLTQFLTDFGQILDSKS